MSRKGKQRKRKKRKQQKNAIRHLKATQIKQPAPTENTGGWTYSVGPTITNYASVSTLLQGSMPGSGSFQSLGQPTPRGRSTQHNNVEVRELDFTNLHQLAYEKWIRVGRHRLSPLNSSTIAIRAAAGEAIKIDVGPEQDYLPPELSRRYRRVVVKAPANLIVVLAQEVELTASTLRRK
jgi:hypothetical protein